MFRYKNGNHLAERFGEFGGRYFEDDFIDMNKERNLKIEQLINSNEFEDSFNQAIKKYVSDPEIRTITYQEKQITVLEEQSAFYGILGQIILARMLGIRTVNMGVLSFKKAVFTAKVCQGEKIDLNVVLSRKLSKDEELKKLLKDFGAHTDDEICSNMFDMPTIFALGNVMTNPDSFMVYEGANSSDYPGADLVGKLAGVFGQRVNKLLDTTDYEIVIAPVTDGTELLGLYNGIFDENKKYVSCEEPICQEYHDGNSLMTRSADDDEPNRVLCPQLAYLWRMGKVIRLGCDSYRILNIKELEKERINVKSARALILASEFLTFNSAVLLEVSNEQD